MSTTESPQNENENEANKISIEKSREKRLARVKSKQRDRGGIFKPAETNPLIDILMARDVVGRSPSKARRKSSGVSLKRGKESGVDFLSKPKGDNGKRSKTPAAAGNARRKSGKGHRAGSEDIIPSKKLDEKKISKSKSDEATKSRRKDPEHQSGSKDASHTGKPAPPKKSMKRPREDTEPEIANVTELPSPPKRQKKTTQAEGKSSRQSTLVEVEDTDSDALHKKQNNRKSRPTTDKKKGAQKRGAQKRESSVGVDSEAEVPKQAPASSKKTKQRNGSKVSSRKNVVEKKEEAPAEGPSPIHRSFIAKPTLDTVEEEDEDVQDPGPGPDLTRKGIDSGIEESAKSKRKRDTEESEGGGDLEAKGKAAKKAKEPKATKPQQIKPSKSTSSKARKPRSNKKSKASVNTDELTSAALPSPDDKENSPALPSTPNKSVSGKSRKQKTTTTNIKKPPPKPKSTQMKWSKKPSKFANLPTTVMNSPIKAIDSDLDELDFLS